LSEKSITSYLDHAFEYQVDNGIPIKSGFEDPKGTELLQLERFLRGLHDQKDVRQVVKEKVSTLSACGRSVANNGEVEAIASQERKQGDMYPQYMHTTINSNNEWNHTSRHSTNTNNHAHEKQQVDELTLTTFARLTRSIVDAKLIIG
jgi:hypothetical protein